MGNDKPAGRADLQSAYEHATTRVAFNLYKEPKKSKMPTDEVIKALEKASVNARQPQILRYYAATLRLQLAVHARYIDTQHMIPKSLIEHDYLHFASWQTKTTYQGEDIKTMYVATKHTRTGAR